MDNRGHNVQEAAAKAWEQEQPIGDRAQSYFDDVGAFHVKFALPVAMHYAALREIGVHPDLRGPSLVPTLEWMYRANFMDEELAEFRIACNSGNLHDAADALADLVWVALGTAHHLGLPFEQIWAEVRRANMEKTVGAPDATHKRPGERIRKPPGWVAPDHRRALGLPDEFAEAHGGRSKNMAAPSIGTHGDPYPSDLYGEEP